MTETMTLPTAPATTKPAMPKPKMAAHRAWVADKRKSLIERGKAAEWVIGYVLVATAKGGCSYHPLARIDRPVRETLLANGYEGARLFIDKDSSADNPGYEEIEIVGNTFDADEGLVKNPVTLVQEKKSAWPGMKKKPGGLVPVTAVPVPVPAAVVPAPAPEPTPAAPEPEAQPEPTGLGGEADGRLELPPLAVPVPEPVADDVIPAGDLPEPPAATPTPGEPVAEHAPPAGWTEVEGGVVTDEPDAPAAEVDAVEREKAAIRAEMDAKIEASGGGAGDTPPAAAQPVVYYRKKGGKYVESPAGDDLTEGVVYRRKAGKRVGYEVVSLEELTAPAGE